MKKLFLLFFLISNFFSPLCALEIKKYLQQSFPFLRQELRTVSAVPPSLIENEYIPYLSGKSTFAVAEYVPQKNKIFIFNTPLKKWLSSQKNPQPALLARCLAPVYLHELSHARDYLSGKKYGFVWPITTSDEQIATFWQIYFIKEKLKQDSDYYKGCEPFMPKKNFLQVSEEQLEEHILKYYSFLPPPITEENITQLKKNRNILYKGFSFKQKRSVLSVNSFFKKGGSWLEIKNKELDRLRQDSYFHLYTQEKSRHFEEIKRR